MEGKLSPLPVACCQRCGSPDVQRSHRRPWERPLSWLGVLPYRCQECLARFYRIRRLQPRRALTEASE